MVKSIPKSPMDVNAAVDMLSCKDLKDKKLNPMKILILRELVSVLEPFLEALESVEEQMKVTISYVGPVILGLKKSLQNILASGLTYCERLAAVLQESVNTRLDTFLNSDEIMVASFLDPRFKLEWISSQEMKDQLLSFLHTWLRYYSNSNQEQGNSDSEGNVSSNYSTTRNTAPQLFSFLSAAPMQNAPMRPYAEANLKHGILPFTTDPLMFWKNSPISIRPLANIARGVIGCSATSAPSERLFSIAGNYYSLLCREANWELRHSDK